MLQLDQLKARLRAAQDQRVAEVAAGIRDLKSWQLQCWIENITFTSPDNWHSAPYEFLRNIKTLALIGACVVIDSAIPEDSTNAQ